MYERLTTRLRAQFLATFLPLATLLPLAILVLTVPALAVAQDEAGDEAAKPEKIFKSGTVIKATITGPWSTIERKKDSGETWPGSFSYEENGQTVTIPITIETRGITRKRVCDFPPLRLSFDKEASKNTAFRGAGRLKLVTHCKDGARYANYYIKEYLSYHILNLVTPLSFRVQGLDLTYVPEGGGKGDDHFGFLIEDVDDVAKRNELVKLDIPKTHPKDLDPVAINRVSMFAYLIANLDWAALSGPTADGCCHNSRLVAAAPDAKPRYPVPYDFDSTGLVNPEYAAPPEQLKVKKMTQRLYRGFCMHNDSLPGVVEEFRTLRPQIMALFENESRLPERERKDSVEFLQGFYDELKDDKGVQKYIIDNCRG